MPRRCPKALNLRFEAGVKMGAEQNAKFLAITDLETGYRIREDLCPIPIV